MTQFSVLTQPWIPVKHPDGTREDVGLWDALTKAHQYTGLCCESPLEEYSIQRLLIAFLMDAYQPQTYRDRRALYRKGCFDPDVLQRYITMCEQEGASFDLFDEKRPFMQATYNEKWDNGKEKPVSSIIHTASSGNNHIHFEHHFVDEYSLTHAQALRAMLASYVFCMAGAQGYPSSVNNTPCNYYLVFGKTLFHTLVLNMLSVLECGNIPWNTPPVAWRDFSEIIPKQEHTNVSILSAFTWQPRRITLLSINETVTQTYYQQGKNFLGNALWMEPHAAFGKSAKDEWFTIKPKSGRSLWRDIGTIAASSDSSAVRHRPPLPSLSYHQIVSETQQLVPLWVTGLVTNQAAIAELQEDTLYIPNAILSEPELGEQLQCDIQLCEQIASEFATHYKIKKKKKENNQIFISHLLQEQFFIACHKLLFTQYLPTLASTDICTENWQAEISTFFIQELSKIVKEIQNQAATYIGSSGRNLILLTQCNNAFNQSYRKIIKKG